MCPACLHCTCVKASKGTFGQIWNMSSFWFGDFLLVTQVIIKICFFEFSKSMTV